LYHLSKLMTDPYVWEFTNHDAAHTFCSLVPPKEATDTTGQKIENHR
jgi:hypothetical protein